MRTAFAIFLFLFCSSCETPVTEQTTEDSDTIVTDPVPVNMDSVDKNCLNHAILKTEKLGNTGYSLQVPFGFAVIADNDSCFRLLAPFLYGENVSSIEFLKKPHRKIPIHQDQYRMFKDIVCDTNIETISFEALDYSFVNADIPAPDSWISIRGGVKCDDAKTEKLQLDTLYAILRTVKSAK